LSSSKKNKTNNKEESKTSNIVIMIDNDPDFIVGTHLSEESKLPIQP